MSEFFLKLKYVRADLKVELDCLNWISLFCLIMPKKKKKDLKRAAGVDISNFRKDWFS